MSAQTLKVLCAFAANSRDELPGVEIMRETRLSPGTVYPILARLERAGWLLSRWECEEPAALGRPRRRFYRITALGSRNAREALSDLQPLLGRVART